MTDRRTGDARQASRGRLPGRLISLLAAGLLWIGVPGGAPAQEQTAAPAQAAAPESAAPAGDAATGDSVAPAAPAPEQPAPTGEQAQAAPQTLVFGYLGVKDDPRYAPKLAFAGLPLAVGGRPIAGAEVAIKESAVFGRRQNLKFEVEEAESTTADEFVAAINRLKAERNVHFFLLDAPDDIAAAVAQATRGTDILLFNISATGDALRGTACQAHLLNVIPSERMLSDALAQFLIAHKWRDVLVLEGPDPADLRLTDSFVEAAKRYGLRVEDRRKFVLGNDPRNREQNNLALLTGEADYDTVFIADVVGEFARYLPYQTMLPRPLIGSVGLTPMAWHWAFDRYGSAQVQRRFLKQVDRGMLSEDWAAWASVKAVVEALVRTNSTDFATLAGYIRSDKMTLDASKGQALTFRPWDNQLRQTIFLATHNWVVAEAPLEGFLHEGTNFDTLGTDQKDSQCRF